ncbi:hypothetical protein DSO57_1033981 [Entomophthora muscae]|uniref:Uncharacterized protein n=1 Tax=Entomophthora muscae TaxID=34485 RepID=A0ACC2TLN8_9FUNG|nr:hypothetical protein DSO57_1033981 [Entomophthora muscae]
MAAARYTLVKEKIEEFRELEEESVELRECYELLEKKPSTVEGMLNSQFSDLGFSSLSIIKMPTNSTDEVKIQNFNPVEVVKKLKSALERQGQAATIDNMKTLIFSFTHQN